ncbi:hypothetical protein D3C81_2045180 [compost metagenome]
MISASPTAGTGAAFFSAALSFFAAALVASGAGVPKDSLDASTIAATAFGSTRCMSGWNCAISWLTRICLRESKLKLSSFKKP